MKLDRDFVHYWCGRYEAEELGTRERELFETTHEAVEARGYLTSDELGKIITWKSPRALGHLGWRDDKTVGEVTRVAFADDTPPWMRHHILCIIRGVRHPVASAILTVWKPDANTVVDVRVIQALRKLWRLGALDFKPPSRSDRYWTYLKAFQRIAPPGVEYRDLDRALWKWNKAGMPRTWSVHLPRSSRDGYTDGNVEHEDGAAATLDPAG